MQQSVTLRVNGTDQAVVVETHHTLLEVLRNQLGLLGAREACGIGVCGACTVLVDGRPMSSCLALAVLAEGREVLTVEGLAKDGELHPVQQAFIDATAFQCSYCTSGFILQTLALLDENPSPKPSDISGYLGGNLCRCGSYRKISEAVQLAAARRPAEGAAVDRQRGEPAADGDQLRT